MNKKTIENIAKSLPAFFKNAIDYVKENFESKGAKVFENLGGTVGVLINLFAQPLIDKYFDSLSENKLENFGYNTYLKTSLLQARASLDGIESKIDGSVNPKLIFDTLNKTLQEEISIFDKTNILLIFQPQYHPAAVFVKNSYQRILGELNVNAVDIKIFIKRFNEGIEANLIQQFGSDYDEHIKKTEKFRLKDTETAFLWDTTQQGKIGFKDSENLRYESTYGQWKKTSDFRQKDDEDLDTKQNTAIENKLVKLENLIEEYFSNNPNNSLQKILFLIADFGKGKSIFLKYYASTLAKDYLETSEGYFPVYFNLRNFKNFSTDSRLGVISEYLETNYSIKIDDEYFQKKKFVFLVDSLDESGELNKRTIDKVIASVKSIQGINKSKFKTNRIIISSRPFDEGFSHHLTEHEPHVIENDEGREIQHFISIYGFTKSQFNEWLLNTLSSFPNIGTIPVQGFAKKIITSINQKVKIDIYDELLKNKTLSRSELRRPIFAYMIYQLIVNNVDFLSVGKLGVYMSFLNLLTKEAKHIHDVNYRINLREEFEFRNVLHATASLWAYERQSGRQGLLKKADICRVLDGKDSEESDYEVLERFKGQNITEIQFLSHSYFGENDNILHFQHQSFAEILLAEYYVKVLIKFSLDEDADIEDARVKLTIGEPTEQTILFLQEILRLIRETSVNSYTKDIMEKRKLLFPLMASLASKKHNRLFCNDVYYSWYMNCEIKENQIDYPFASLEKWCIDKTRIDKIIRLATNILNAKTNYLPIKISSKTALFNNEVIKIQNQSLSSIPFCTDHWLALLSGNILCNDFGNSQTPILFNTAHEIDCFRLFEMIKSRNFTFNESAPSWGKSLFKGLNMSKMTATFDLSHYNFDGIDFSYSHFKYFRAWNANWSRCALNHCVFEQVSFITCLFFDTEIFNIKSVVHPFYMSNCETNDDVKLLDIFNTTNLDDISIHEPFKFKMRSFASFDEFDSGAGLFKTLRGFFVFGLQHNLFNLDQLKTLFEFNNKSDEKYFNKQIDRIKQYSSKK